MRGFCDHLRGRCRRRNGCSPALRAVDTRLTGAIPPAPRFDRPTQVNGLVVCSALWPWTKGDRPWRRAAGQVWDLRYGPGAHPAMGLCSDWSECGIGPQNICAVGPAGRTLIPRRATAHGTKVRSCGLLVVEKRLVVRYPPTAGVSRQQACTAFRRLVERPATGGH